MSGVELMHDSVVRMERCRQTVSASRSGGETAAVDILVVTWNIVTTKESKEDELYELKE